MSELVMAFLGAMGGTIAAAFLLGIWIMPHFFKYARKTLRRIRRKYRTYKINRKKHDFTSLMIIMENSAMYFSNRFDWNDRQKRHWNDAIHELYTGGALGTEIEHCGIYATLSMNHGIDPVRNPDLVFQLNLFRHDPPSKSPVTWQMVPDKKYELLLNILVEQSKSTK